VAPHDSCERHNTTLLPNMTIKATVSAGKYMALRTLISLANGCGTQASSGRAAPSVQPVRDRVVAGRRRDNSFSTTLWRRAPAGPFSGSVSVALPPDTVATRVLEERPIFCVLRAAEKF
jgi:hypothetical protein